jgi:hypothetical protein
MNVVDTVGGSAVLETQALRFLIRQKLIDGGLPHGGIPRVWGSLSHGQRCHACDELIAKSDFVMEGLLPRDGRPGVVQLHVLCCYLWDDERRHSPERPTPAIDPAPYTATAYEGHTIVTEATQHGIGGWAVAVSVRDIDGAVVMGSSDLGGGVTFGTRAIAEQAGVLLGRAWIDRRA